MTWISIILWLITNLPDLIALFRKLFAKAQLMPVAERESLRVEISRAILAGGTRAERRRRVREILAR